MTCQKSKVVLRKRDTPPQMCCLGHKYFKCLSTGVGKNYPYMKGEVEINKNIPWVFSMVLHRGTLLREVQEAYYTYLYITIFLLKMELVKKPITYVK